MAPSAAGMACTMLPTQVAAVWMLMAGSALLLRRSAVRALGHGVIALALVGAAATPATEKPAVETSAAPPAANPPIARAIESPLLQFNGRPRPSLFERLEPDEIH